MSFVSRISNGWELAKISFETIKNNQSLLLFPVFSVISLVLVLLTFAGGSFYFFGDEISAMLESENETAANVLAIGGIFLYYLINFFVIVYFNAALIFCASKILNNEPATLSDGIQFANSRIDKIFGWALVSATVGTLLQLLQNTGKIGDIVSKIFGVAWSILTFFAVPVLVFQDRSVLDTIRESGRIMKDKWGESLAANVSFGLFYLLGGLVAFGIGVLLSTINPVLGIAVGILIVLLVSTIVATAKTIFVAAAYNRVTGAPIGNFDGETLDSVFITK
jgi:hypothetical protein